MTLPTDQLDRLAVDTIRTLSIDGVQQANSGHPGAPMGMAPMAYALWTRHLRHAPTNPAWPDRDRFVLSAGHASMLLYSLLHLTGYAVSPRRPQVLPPVGLDHPGPPGVRHDAGRRGDDRAAGPGPGQRRRHGHRGAPARARSSTGPATRSSTTARTSSAPTATSRRAIASEASSLAGHLKLGKLDRPLRRQPDPAGRPHGLGVHRGRRRALRRVRLAHPARGGRQRRRRDLGRHRGRQGRRPAVAHRRPHPHRLRQPEQAGHPEGARRPAGPGRGPPHQGGLRLGPGQDVLRPGRGGRAVPPRRRRGQGAGGRRGRPRSTPTPRPSRPRPPSCAGASRAPARRLGRGPPRLRDGLRGRDPEREPGRDPGAGRPCCRSCSAGPRTSRSPTSRTSRPWATTTSRPDHAGRNIRFGVREHAMGGIANGIAYHGGFLPYCATFLTFSDYMRGSVRIAALSGLPRRSTSGPTTPWAWARTARPTSRSSTTRRCARSRTCGSSARATRTRRPRPGRWRWSGRRSRARGRPGRAGVHPPEAADAAGHEGGRPRGRPPRRVRPARGRGRRAGADPDRHGLRARSCAFAAAEALEADGIPTRVVSLPCWERFEAQDPAYREASCRRPCRKRVTVEAGVSLGWERWAGDEGAIIGIDHFGASAPAGTIFKEFGFTADAWRRRAARGPRGAPRPPADARVPARRPSDDR